MSNQFYNYLSNKLFDYFDKNALEKGEKFYIQFDEDSQIKDFYDSIKEYAIDNNSYEEFSYKHEKGDEFLTFSIKCGEIKLVIVESTSISEDYLVTLRNQVSGQNGVWRNSAILIIYDEAKDSIFNGMGNLATDGMPLNIDYLSENLEDEIIESKTLKKSIKEILKFTLKNLKEDIFQTTIWDYKNILAIIRSGEITTEDLFELKLFPDANLNDFNAHKMQSRLRDNNALFDEIEKIVRYGDVKEDLKKSFSDKGVKVLSSDEWYLTDYKDVKDFKKKGVDVPLNYEENHEKVTNEGLIYWEKPLSSSKPGMRKRQIIIFNPENVDKVSFSLSFDQRTKNEFLSRDAKYISNSAGKKLKVEFKVSNSESTFKQVSYKHNNQNSSHYIFNILVLNTTPDILDSIKSRYTIAYNKKKLIVTNDEDSDDLILGIGDNLIEKEIEDKNEKVFLYDEDSILISEASPAWEEGYLRFDLIYNDTSIPFEINEKSKKPVPVKSSKIWNLKRQNRENFNFTGAKAIQGVNSVYLEDKFKEFLNLERQIIENNIYYGIKEVDGTIKKQDLEFSEELTNAYDAIFEYYKTFDDTPEDNLPSLVYLNDDLKELYANFLEIFNHEISEINDNDILADFKYKKDLIKLGRIDDDKRIMYSSLSPINIAYQLEVSNQCGDDELYQNLADCLVPNNLIPYVYSDLNELYRPIYQETAHEWLIYERSEEVSIGTTNAFISNVVSEKLNQFVKHFDYLFDINTQSPIRINLININDDLEVVKGVFSFIRDRLIDKVKTKGTIPVEINIYNDSDRSSFDLLFKCDSKEEINDIFSIDVKSNLLDPIDIIRSVQNNITYYHHSLNSEYEYSHISFYKITSDMEPVHDNMDKMETGLSLNGLISSVASTTKHSDYRTGFGTKYILDKDNTLVKSAININELIENSKNRGKNAYSKNKSVVTSITLDEENIDELYKKSHWITFIEPTFGIEYFDNSDSVVIIHYSDQYTSSNKYDTITVTKKSTQYKQAITQFLKEKNIIVQPDELNGIIRMFNSINGEWLLKIVSSSGEFDREKISLISAAKYGLSLFDHKDIIWVPISLEEILRITRNLKLDKSKGPISAFIKQGSYSDDLLFIGLKFNDEENLELIYHPVEVKIGNNDSNVIKKGKYQVKRTHKLLYDLLNDNDSKFVNKYFRNFFVQLFLSNQQKFLVNEIWDEKDLELVEKYKAKLLNDDYTISYDLEEYLGKGSLFSFKSACDYQSLFIDENIQIIEIPEEFAYDTLAKSVNELFTEIQSNNTDIQVNDLLSQIDLDNIPKKTVDIPNGYDSSDDMEDDFTSVDDSFSEDIIDDASADDSIDEIIDEGVSDDNGDSVDNDDSFNEENDVENQPSTQYINSIDLESVRGLIGTAEGSSHEIYWEFGASEINNRHMLIQGASGYGKSYFIQKMLKELSNQGIPSIIIDYTDGFKKSKLEPEFKDSLGDRIEQHNVLFNKFPLNPFKKHLIEYDEEYVPEPDVLVASRFKNVISSVYNFGDQQEIAIYNAAISGLSKYGDEMDLVKFKEELIKQDSPQSSSVLSKLTQFLDMMPFETNDFDWSYIDNSGGKVIIIQLSGYPKDVQKIISEFILWDLWNYKSNSGEEDNPFIVVLDEAQNLSFNGNSPCGKILVEGRKFGWSGWFATQFVKGALKADEINRLENASEKIYFHPNENSISDIAGNLSADNSDRKMWEQKLSKLNKGQCIVHGHLRNSNGEVYSAKPVCVDISRISESSSNVSDESEDDGTPDESSEITEKNHAGGKYGKYISLHNGLYKVHKLIDGKQRFIGMFKSPEDAIVLRDYLIENNWDLTNIPQGLLSTPNQDRYYYIREIKGRFIVSRMIDGERKYFGSFDSLEEAVAHRDYLIENNWEVNDNIEEEKIDDFVYLINGKYVVRNEIDGELKIFGEFDDMNEALQYRIECMRKAWKL